MSVISASTWLDVWERAGTLPAARRDIELLRTACTSHAELEQLPVGARDRLLLELREALFGDPMNCTTRCPACRAICEWACSARSLRAVGSDTNVAGVHEWAKDAWRVRFRAVNAADLMSLADCRDESAASARLLSRCVLDASCEGQAVAAGELPAPIVEAVSAAMEQVDRQACLELALTCPDCSHGWTVDFDAGDFLWTELDAWAQRTLLEVHQLAGRYGWTEREILLMTPARRARYLAIGAA